MHRRDQPKYDRESDRTISNDSAGAPLIPPPIDLLGRGEAAQAPDEKDHGAGVG